MEIYGSAVSDKLDKDRDILKRRYYRQVNKPTDTGSLHLCTVMHPAQSYTLKAGFLDTG